MRLSLIFGICATQKAGIGTATIDCVRENVTICRLASTPSWKRRQLPGRPLARESAQA